MFSQPLRCPKCQAPLLGATLPGGGLQPCAACGTQLRVDVFSALFRRLEAGQAAELVTQEREAACFYHPQKKAVEHCAGCGRYVCALCDCEMQGKHYCPGCLEAGRTKGKIVNLDNERTLYGNLALTLAVVPLLCYYFTIITAPITLWMAVRHWRSPPSLLQGHRFKLAAAAVIAVLQILAWCVVAYLIFEDVQGTYESNVSYEVTP